MSDAPDLLREFQRRMESAGQIEPGTSAELLLEDMDAQGARLFRLCAIPHRFDADVLQTLAPWVERGEIEKRCADFSQLSFVATETDGWALHDDVRRHFFSQWLGPQRAAEFTAGSARLAAFFKAQIEHSQGERAEVARRRRMFHLIGADQDAGFQEFVVLLRRARNFRLYSECSQLVRLVHEYDGFLAPRYRRWLTYHDAKLSADLQDLERAEAGYKEVLNDPESSPEQRSAADVRLGYVYNERGNWGEAIRHYEQGLMLAQNSERMQHMLPRILHDLGAAYRDKGDLGRAQELLTRSVELAEKPENLASLALAYNGLGTLALKRRDVRAAVDAFEKCLDALVRNHELFRTAQVYNNLGLAYADLADWARSEEFFQKSLEIKSKAGDTLGQASALNNLARAQASRADLKAAIESSSRAIELFTALRHPYHAALARHNRGKLYRRMKQTELAHRDFVDARESFRALGKLDDAAAVARDLEDKRVGLPWWAWGAIALFVILFIAIMLAIVVAVLHEKP